MFRYYTIQQEGGVIQIQITTLDRCNLFKVNMHAIMCNLIIFIMHVIYGEFKNRFGHFEV